MGHQRLGAGDKAPDFAFDTPWERGLRYYGAVAGSPSVLFFLRYFGCPICRMEMAELERRVFLTKAAAQVFVILQSAPSSINTATGPAEWPFTIVCDPRGEVFRSYAVNPGGILKYMHPAGLAGAVRATLKGFRHGRFEGRETQLPACFVIGPDKKIRYAHYGKHIGDLPPWETVAAQIV